VRRGDRIDETWEVWMPTLVGGEADRLVGSFMVRDDAVEQRDIVKETFQNRDPELKVLLLHVKTERTVLSEE
jgi:hypothetical protein